MIQSSDEKKNVTECRNCGCACTSNFCPDCGQSVSERRLDNKTFFIGIITGLSRVNKGFLFTAWHLLINPWRVIRDYIRCRRIRYVAPVPMLILVCFVSAFAGALLSAEALPAISVTGSGGDAPPLYRIIRRIGNFVLSSELTQNLTFYIPALLAIPIVYGRAGAGKYNMAEYLTAMIYMACSFIIFNVVTLPVSIISESAYSALGLIYSILICAAGMYFAFPMASKKRRIGYFAIYLLATLLIYIILLILLGLIIGFARASV